MTTLLLDSNQNSITILLSTTMSDTTSKTTSSPDSGELNGRAFPLVTNYDAYRDSPPPLNYSVHDNRRKRFIFIWFFLMFIEAGVLPLILFYALRWGAHLSITINLAIITSLIGSISGFKFAQRQRLLWLGDGNQTRPIGAGRWGVDSFQSVLFCHFATISYCPLTE